MKVSRRDEFDRSVFINCPFDAAYAPILQGILFCVSFLGFTPRISTERTDSAENRLDKIRSLIELSRYSIHDLSRSQSNESNELYRLNMPFELGIDYGCRRYYGNGREGKKILILEEKRYRHQATISDLSGCDLEIHHGKYDTAIRIVRNWLVTEAGAQQVGPQRIIDAYADFQEWDYERLLTNGWSEEDIKEYPTFERLEAISRWIAAGKPT
jgi:hypothetical protein